MRSMKRFCAILLSLSFLILPARAEKPLRRNETDARRIALSFDDGPSRETCGKILEILERYGVRATFFVVGRCAGEDEGDVRAIAEAGHEIGNHTWSHANITRLSEEGLRREVKKTEEILLRITGKRPVLFRPPEGAWNERAVAILKEMGYTTVLWSVDTRDWTKPKVATVTALVERETKGGDVILFHDLAETGATTPAALERVIPYLLGQGYEFVTVSELFSGEE